MVLYHANGEVVKTQEIHLENEAKSSAASCRYTDPIVQATQISTGRDRAAKTEVVSESEEETRVKIVVDAQYYQELYYSPRSSLIGEDLMLYREDDSSEFPDEGIDRRTLMMCSSTAYDFFTSKPDESTLHLPVCYPRQHQEQWYNNFVEADQSRSYGAFVKYYGKRVEEEELAYLTQLDDQMAFIRPEEITKYLIPWLNAMEAYLKEEKNNPKETPTAFPTIETPEILLEKIHLYNVMLQFGISSHFQQPLIDKLIFQMYQTNLSQCHLDTLEMTVGRFYSRGVAVLDPVINHLIGTYSLRNLSDRAADPPEEDRVLKILPKALDKRDLETEVYLQATPTRAWLEFTKVRPDQRSGFADDTVLHPPKLEVIGHCIRHWSGVRRSGSTAAAHTGYPLNVGRVFKYYRRRATSPIHKQSRPGHIDLADYSTYRLHDSKTLGVDGAQYMHDNRPGNVAAPGTGSASDPALQAEA